MPNSYPMNAEPAAVPETLVRAFRVEALDENGDWNVIVREENNYQRLVRIRTGIQTKAVRFIPESIWGTERAHLFVWYVANSQQALNISFPSQKQISDITRRGLYLKNLPLTAPTESIQPCKA